MFGYLTADIRFLQDTDKHRYQQAYCGLCRALATRYGLAGRAALTYDMTFLSMLLSSLYRMPEPCGNRRCAARLFRRVSCSINPATIYAADINILLAYYQRMDGWTDDRDIFALCGGLSLRKAFTSASERRPYQYTVIHDCLTRLSRMEAAGELNPDLPANCFGEMMGEMFVMNEDEWSPPLRRMGTALGRFIYLLDAANDLKKDLRKQRYNPLTAQDSGGFTNMLSMLLAECTAEFEKLPLERDMAIFRNILYSGVWRRYHADDLVAQADNGGSANRRIVRRKKGVRDGGSI